MKNPITLISGAAPVGPGEIFDFSDRVLNHVTIRVQPSADAAYNFSQGTFSEFINITLSVEGAFAANDTVTAAVVNVVVPPSYNDPVGADPHPLGLSYSASNLFLVGHAIPFLRAEVIHPLASGSVIVNMFWD